MAQALVDQTLEGINGESKRCTNVVRTFPNDSAILRLVTAVLVETAESPSVSAVRSAAVDKASPPGPQCLGEAAPARAPPLA